LRASDKKMLLCGMDPEILQQHLFQAEEHVALGEQHISRQRELIAELDRDGHDTKEARQLLATFEQLQALHVEDRDRLRRKISVLD
jgi:Spy/CpxP family protein refolding chaperone